MRVLPLSFVPRPSSMTFFFLMGNFDKIRRLYMYDVYKIIYMVTYICIFINVMRSTTLNYCKFSPTLME